MKAIYLVLRMGEDGDPRSKQEILEKAQAQAAEWAAASPETIYGVWKLVSTVKFEKAVGVGEKP